MINYLITNKHMCVLRWSTTNIGNSPSTLNQYNGRQRDTRSDSQHICIWAIIWRRQIGSLVPVQ